MSSYGLWYVEPAYKKKRKNFLRENPFCVHCDDAGRTTLAQVVDHITPVFRGKTLEDKRKLFDDDRNIQGLCIPCHKLKSVLEYVERGSKRALPSGVPLNRIIDGSIDVKHLDDEDREWLQESFLGFLLERGDGDLYGKLDFTELYASGVFKNLPRDKGNVKKR